MNIVANSEADAVAGIFVTFRDAWANAHKGPMTARLGMAQHLVIAETSAEAERITVPAFNQWRTSLANF
jgi:alkanesulfonate monooxygenase SsuD/methylene tetrahydromethanopterin reductase-like flavin-dependent oxidoreductase (luciferase family)